MNEKELRRTGEMLMESGAYGDAAGVPVETKSYNYIAETYGWIDKLIPTTDNIFYKGIWQEGKTSDDTAGKANIARGLIRANTFDLNAIAEESVKTFSATPDVTIIRNGIKMVKKLGYGSSTSNSMQRQIEGVSPFESGEPGGSGNGVVMEMETLVWWQYARCLSDAERYRQYDLLTTMTHDSDVARIATRVHGDVLFNLLLEDYDDTLFGHKAHKIARFHESKFGNRNNDVSNSLDYIGSSYRPSFGEMKAEYKERAATLSDKEFGKSYGFYVPETLAISYAAFRLGRGDYHETVYTAVNFGGDADSTASISGAMVNFMRKGEQKMPDDLDKVQDLEELRMLSRRLATQALRA